MVSYSNYKRHLKNAHPSLNHEHEELLDDLNQSGASNPEENVEENVQYLGHQMDEDDTETSDKTKDDKFVECHLCGDHIIKDFLERHLKMNHEETVRSDAKMKECPECQVSMPIDLVVKHCQAKHKVSYKYCRPCETFVLKKQFKTHLQGHDHREMVNNGEKHSSHEENEDDGEDLIVDQEKVPNDS